MRIRRDITGQPDLPDYPSERLGRAGVIQAGEQFGGGDVVRGGVGLFLFNLLILNMRATPRYYLKLLSLVS